MSTPGTGSGLRLARLYRDLNELKDSPYEGIQIFTDDANILKFCLVLTPLSGPWEDLSLHFDVKIPERWPAAPPKIKCSTPGITHPNLFGSYICCDILKELNFSEQGYLGGYTPAFTLGGLFVQFLSFFSSSKIEQQHGGTILIGETTLHLYIRECDFADNATPTTLHLSCDSTFAKQAALEKEWKYMKAKPIEIGAYTSSQGPVVHKVKSLEAKRSRIHKFEFPNPRWGETLKSISQWTCDKCPYGSDKLPHHRGALSPVPDLESGILYQPTDHCVLDKLKDDILSYLLSRLPTESVVTLSEAYPRAAKLTRLTHTLIEREVHCFFLRTTLSNSILGIGFSFNFYARTFSSDFDYLSEIAFEKYAVRHGLQRREFEYFLPLAFSKQHFETALASIWKRLRLIDRVFEKAVEMGKKQAEAMKRIRGGDLKEEEYDPVPWGSFAEDEFVPQFHTPTPEYELVRAIYRMMNNLVVNLMKSCDDVVNDQQKALGRVTYASEKAIQGYCHLLHLLICLSRKEVKILVEAVKVLKNFMEKKKMRTKDVVPDLGDLIVMTVLVIAKPLRNEQHLMTWENLSGSLLQEALVRNTYWILKDTPELELLEQGPSKYRLQKTFEKSRTSLRLIMFQLTFMDLFVETYGEEATRSGTGRSGLKKLDDDYGFVEKELPSRMVKEIKEIYAIKTWEGFFKRVRFEKGFALGEERIAQVLREAVMLSAEREYHAPTKEKDLEALVARRGRADSQWQQTQGQ
ncbi:hypothetical protein BDN72DRAFT_954690 [Pluteus cervinus]|uniref:Uncharacterized protein n=1 Tax=Pluteus cervinus TaxID=181527 RepID=A0ACD3BBG5_9AGAR|nr:hypothetical protein BDN72DRAFT_954690 [Pluteus cervinus]